jgi:hypothetical protein
MIFVTTKIKLNTNSVIFYNFLFINLRFLLTFNIFLINTFCILDTKLFVKF